jgi:AmmeMemoRadiSam system protein B
MSERTERVVHEALGGGRWFPGGRRALSSMVDECMEGAAGTAAGGRIVGAISPHAGYVYSGKVAGYVFRAARDAAQAGTAPATVVVIGLSHRGAFQGVALMDGDAVSTPLGETPLDRESGAALAAGDARIYFDYTPHGGEHSAENQIPFVQAALPEAKLVVGIIGDHDPRTIDALAAALTHLAREKEILVVASTDLLHDPDYDKVSRTDRATLKQIESMDVEALERDWSYARQVCCGIGPVLATMKFAGSRGCDRGTVLHYRNSGDDFPDSRGNWVVGYGAVVFTVPE